MQKTFKFSVLGLSFFTILLVFSCKKEVNKTSNSGDSLKSDVVNGKNGIINRLTNPGGTSPVVYSNGHYTSAFGGGLDFGGTFTYPTTMDGFVNGNLWAPTFSIVSTNLNIITYTQNGPYFSISYGTVVNGISDGGRAATEYNIDFNKYLNHDSNQTFLPEFSTYIQRYGGDPSGVITVQGQFVIDSASPTNVSIASMQFNATTPVYNSNILNGYIGLLTNGTDEYELYGYNGTITGVYKKSQNWAEITDFTGQYLVGVRAPVVSVDLTLYPNSSSPIVFSAVSMPKPM